MNTILRAMTPADAEAGYRLTQQLGWAHRREDWQQLIALGEGVVVEAQGDYLGGAIGWRWGADAATIGLVIVSEQARGRGIGRQVMQAMLEKFSDCNVRLHATDMGQVLYEKLGFQACNRVPQHQTRALAQQPSVIVPDGLMLRPAVEADAAAIDALDYQANGLRRARLHQQLRAQSVVLQDTQGKLQGFASRRRFGHGWTIGPVIADDVAAAQALVSQLMQDLAQQFVRLDTPDAQLSAWLLSLGLAQVDAPFAMVYGTPWRAAANGPQTFALVSPALG